MEAGRSLDASGMPEGTHYAITTGLATDFKGLTTAMLNRSRAFVQVTGTPVTILTHAPFDYDEIRDTLRERGFLGEGMALLNKYEDIGTWDDDRIHQLNLEAVGPADSVPQLLELGDPGVSEDRYRRTATVEGEVTQIDHRRANGEVFLTERRGGHDPAIVLRGSGGKVLGTLASARQLLYRWLDTLPRDPRAWIIADSRVSARLLLDYRRPDVSVMHVLHYSHLDGRNADSTTAVKKSSAEVLDRMDELDAMVFLTESQRRDVVDAYGIGSDNRYSVPNVCNVPARVDPSTLSRRRDRRRGVMLARFDRGKQVDIAIRAVAVAADTLDPRRRPRLDVYGGGSRRDLLEDEVALMAKRHPAPLERLLGRALGKPGRSLARLVQPRSSSVRTRLHGHVAAAREEFWRASYSLLTSRAEGSPLVLVEAMGRGAIPISFDIKYGPSDIITHGVDGFLVPFAGDRRRARNAMAAAIQQVVTMSHDELTVMRAAAHRRAQDFSPTSVTRRWIEVMRAIEARKV